MLSLKFLIIAGLILLVAIWACQRHIDNTDSPFAKIPQSFPVNISIVEASGIASSKINPGHLWVQEDSGAPSQILLLKNDGTFIKSIYIHGATNNDWEDMALSKGPNSSLDYLYLADFGDNDLTRNDYVIYRFAEPVINVDTIKSYDKIMFQYPDGSHNAEAIFVDNHSNDIYIITKSDNPSRIYKLPFPHHTNSVNTAISIGQLGLSGVTGAAISQDGKEIIIKTYPAVSYYLKSPGQSIEQCLMKKPLTLSYQVEPQGEAIAFASDNSGFYTLSERGINPVVNLFFYKRTN